MKSTLSESQVRKLKRREIQRKTNLIRVKSMHKIVTATNEGQSLDLHKVFCRNALALNY